MFKNLKNSEKSDILYLPNGDKFVSRGKTFGTLIQKNGNIFDGEFSGNKL